jgi:glutamyl-tRNA synthetase
MGADEGPFYQSASRARHAADAHRLLSEGHAYRCFCDPARLREERESAGEGDTVFMYPRACRGLAAADGEWRARAGEPFAIRFRVPEGRVEWADLVHGPTGFDADTIEDFVLLRSDGSPTYMLSVVSDDVAMRITHVIRGDDHLSNTPKQILLYRALGQQAPQFGHLPLILGDDRKRLSKRHGAVSVLEYRERGYLGDAVFNFLALLGWSPGDDRQKMSRDELIGAFDLAGVGRSGAIFDLQKLEWLNGQYLAELPVETIAIEVKPRLEAAGLWRGGYEREHREWYLDVLRLLQPRARTLDDFVAMGRYLFDPNDALAYDPAAESKHLRGEGLAAGLQRWRDELALLEPWTAAPLEQALRRLAAEMGMGAGKLIHPTRLAVTGRGESPGLFEVLELLGRDRTLARVDRLLARLDGRGGA